MQVQEDFKPRERRRHPGQSQHFWEFKADQVLNKVFDQQQAKPASKDGKEFTDVEILSFRAHETPERTNNSQEKKLLTQEESNSGKHSESQVQRPSPLPSST
jgi:hypothetical protein